MLETLFSLEGKVALVTGGSKGLGEAFARALAEAGADVAICSRHKEEAAAAAQSIRADTGREVIALEADTGKAADVDRMVEQAVASLNGLDVLVNNAGINRHSYVNEQDEDDWNAVLQVNLTGPM